MNPLELSETKQFALKVLDCFDDLAKPEIKNSVMLKVWEFVKGRTYKIILRKPDIEIRTSLRKVHETLGPMFNDVDLSEQIRHGELLGSPRIPNVGNLAKIKKLTDTSKEDILRELNL